MKERHDLKAAPNPYKMASAFVSILQKHKKAYLRSFNVIDLALIALLKKYHLLNRFVFPPVHFNRIKPFYDTNDRPIQSPKDTST